MPDETGKLTLDEKQKVIAWIASKQDGPISCPICKKTTWFVGDHIVLPLTMGANQQIELGGGLTYPQVMIVSETCGYTMFINAVVVGLASASVVPNQSLA